MKILLVAINAKYIHSNPAVHSLRSCAGEYKSCIEIAEFTINQPPDFILREIYKRQPGVIAFSCYIWNRDVMDALIPDLHRILPHADIWAGGPEVSYDAAATIERWRLRGVMTGPGEAAFARLTAAYAAGSPGELPAVLDGAHIPRLMLDEIPFWYEEMQDFEHRIVYYESSRGCPFSCSYCLSSIDRVMDFRQTGRVCRELDYFLERKVPQVKFIDRTFNCKKEHALPILRHILTHDNGVTNFHFEIAAEPASCPKLTRGKFQYDFGDEAGYTPLLPMFTLGHNFAPANIHAGGLRYHGAGVIVSQLLKDGYMEAVDIKQLESFDAGCLFAQAEGIIPAPESCHAIAATIREANKCKETGEEKVILFNLSGHGLIDMASYDKYLSGDLVNYELTDADIQKNLDEIGNLA